ncbi:MAG: glycine cleavage system aminomethyltransferase GcvT [Polyangia bacterium]
MSDTPRNEKPALRKTPLYDRHVAQGARIVDFGGWAMPVQYSSILDEHRAVRGAVGLFDVCHMGEVRFTGPGALSAVERLVTNDVRKLVDGQARYTTVLYEHGGIVDDCIVYRESADSILIVINAANTEKDIAWFRASLAGRSDVEFADLSAQTGLIAVQGPRAAALLDKLAPGDGFSALKSFHFKDGTIAGVRVWAARTGYTGEDGFELFCPWDDSPRVWDALLEAGQELGVKPCGLGARDTLRLEACLSLYGNDIDQTTSPYEANLGWVVKLDHDFIGRAALEAQKQTGISRKLVALVMDDSKAIARHGYNVYEGTEGGEPIGVVTSGTVGPTVGKNVALGYVPVALSAVGGRVYVDIRGRRAPALIVKPPFYKRSAAT